MALEAEGSNPSTHLNPLSGAGGGFFISYTFGLSPSGKGTGLWLLHTRVRIPPAQGLQQPDFSENRSRAAFSILRKHGQWIFDHIHNYVLSESFLHLPLRLIFRQSHPNFINVRTAYASEIWAQLTKNLLAKSSTKRFRESLFLRIAKVNIAQQSRS